jgi:RNA polymerase subunit RPABC4/transcription elongation factor Spt4
MGWYGSYSSSSNTSVYDKSAKCTRCDHILEAGQKFCTKCGAPRKIIFECSKCKRVFQEGEKFCPEDGSPKPTS